MSDEEIGSREPREKTHLEIKPFNKETNEELNQSARFNHIDNGSRLPMKFEIFPKQLLGMPIYDLGPRPNEKVNYLSLSLLRPIIFHGFLDILCYLITVQKIVSSPILSFLFPVLIPAMEHSKTSQT